MPRRTCHDDYPQLAQGGHPNYQGHPAKLSVEALALARELLLAGRSTAAIAEIVGYVDRTSFGRAFQTATGERPGAFQRRHGVVGKARRGWLSGRRRRSTPDRSGEVPLPRYPKIKPDPDRSSGT